MMDISYDDFINSQVWALVRSKLHTLRAALMDDLRTSKSWDEHNVVIGRMDAIDLVETLPQVLFPKEVKHNAKS